MKELLNRVTIAFKRATKGEEPIGNVIWIWGVVAYLFAFFVANKTIKAVDHRSIDFIISLVMSLYFLWHIYALKKCAPKKPKLTPEEKIKLKEQRRHRLGKSFLRKLFLQESITEWDPVFITMVIDVLCITHFVGYF